MMGWSKDSQQRISARLVGVRPGTGTWEKKSTERQHRVANNPGGENSNLRPVSLVWSSLSRSSSPSSTDPSEVTERHAFSDDGDQSHRSSLVVTTVNASLSIDFQTQQV